MNGYALYWYEGVLRASGQIPTEGENCTRCLNCGNETSGGGYAGHGGHSKGGAAKRGVRGWENGSIDRSLVCHYSVNLHK